jgi:hypothetical protein
MIEYTDSDQFDGADGRAPTENLAPGPGAQPDAAEAPEPVDEFAGPTTTEEQSDAGTSAPETTDPEPSPTPASAPAPKPTSGAKKSKEKKTMPTLATKPAPKPAPTPKPAKAPTPAPKAPKPAKAPTPVKAPPAPPKGHVGVNGNGKAAPVKDKGTPVKAKLKVDAKAPAAGKPKAAKAPGKPKSGDKVSIIDAAATVLKGRKTPMSCKDLMEEIVKRGLRKAPTTKYPGSNLGFILITDIENKGKESRFVKTAPGRFAYNHK